MLSQYEMDYQTWISSFLTQIYIISEGWVSVPLSRVNNSLRLINHKITLIRLFWRKKLSEIRVREWTFLLLLREANLDKAPLFRNHCSIVFKKRKWLRWFLIINKTSIKKRTDELFSFKVNLRSYKRSLKVINCYGIDSIIFAFSRTIWCCAKCFTFTINIFHT